MPAPKSWSFHSLKSHLIFRGSRITLDRSTGKFSLNFWDAFLGIDFLTTWTIIPGRTDTWLISMHGDRFRGTLRIGLFNNPFQMAFHSMAQINGGDPITTYVTWDPILQVAFCIHRIHLYLVGGPPCNHLQVLG